METDRQHAPLISIVTVTFNAASVLEPTMESVRRQTFQDYEHIIVDGGSPDTTLAIASRYSGTHVSIHSRPDSGIYHGMNRGLKHASGKYVLFLNAGDRFADEKTLARYAEGCREGMDIIYGETLVVDGDGNVLRPRHHSVPAVLTLRSYLGGMLVCHQAFMVRRAIAPAYSREFRLSADYEWCLACIERSALIRRLNLNAVTIHYLEGGMSQKKKMASLRERFVIMKRRFGLLPTLRAHLALLPAALKRRVGAEGWHKA